MKPEIKKILGKTIKGVVVGEGEKGPQSQILLVFTDNTFFEIYAGEPISVAGMLKNGGIKAAMKALPAKNDVKYCFFEDSTKSRT